MPTGNEEAQQIITQQENEELKENQFRIKEKAGIDYHRYWKKRAEEAEERINRNYPH